jgi:hypothetical protein
MLRSTHLAAGLLIAASFSAVANAQDDAFSHRGRKYKAPPATSHIEVLVLRGYNGKPIANAAVVFHSVKDDKDEGNLEVKTNEEGKAVIDVIPTGSKVGVQIIADGFATYADDYQVNETDRTITVKMLRSVTPRHSGTQPPILSARRAGAEADQPHQRSHSARSR